MTRHIVPPCLILFACLLPASFLSGCQSFSQGEQVVPEKPQVSEVVEESDDVIDWFYEAQQAKSIDTFILALLSMMGTGLIEELSTFYHFTDSDGLLITPDRWQKARMTLPCPTLDNNWIYLSNYQVANGHRINFRVEKDNGLYWCAIVVAPKAEQYVIIDIIDYKTNISVVSSLESIELLPPVESIRTARITRSWGVRELLTTNMSLSELDQLIEKNNLDQNNSLIKTARVRRLMKPISIQSLLTYNQIIPISAEPDDWPLQQFYQFLGWGAPEEKLMQLAQNFTRVTGDAAWPYVFWARVATAYKDNELSERLLQIAMFNDPLNELPYFALMRTYAAQKQYGHLLEVRSLLESKFDYRIEPTYFWDRPDYEEFVVSESFKNWANQR